MKPEIHNANTVPALPELMPLEDGCLSFITQVASTVHYHHCYQVVISLTDTVNCTVDGQHFYGLKGFIINQSVPCSWTGSDLNVLVVYIEPASLRGRQLRVMLEGKAWLNMNSMFDPGQFEIILPLNYKNLPNYILMHYINAALDFIILKVSHIKDFAIDDRIRAIVLFISQNLHIPLMLEDMAAHIKLSSGRTRHLFIEEMGIPFSQYVLWEKLKKTIEVSVVEKILLGKACLMYGFTDQPHFNRRFKRMFGIPPYVIIRKSRFLL